MNQRCVLIVLDGWGLGRKDFSNPLHQAKLPTIEYLKKHYSSAALQASGIAVGLPWEAVGNSEVGHLTIGAGKVIYQHYPRISLAIQNGSFFKNEFLLQAIEHAKSNKASLNLVGLLTEGHAHASFEHLAALLEMASQQGLNKVNLHLFADGKDGAPHSIETLYQKLQSLLRQKGVGTVASLSGRYYGMDRDGHWDRTEKAYRAMTAAEASQGQIDELIGRMHEQGKNDDFLPPFVFGPQARPIQNGDSLVFFNYREDSIRQIAASFILENFDKFERENFQDLFISTFTDYSEQFKVPVAFPQPDIKEPLGKVLSDAGKTQLLIAETEKYAHVTYFFNGYRDQAFEGQFPVLIPSENVARHDQKPQMRAAEISERIVQAVEEGSYDFIFANFANADMVAHTGNFDATVKAAETIDQALGPIVKACEATGTALFITSDHGNAESLFDPMTGQSQTSHDPNPVPVYALGKDFEGGSRPSNENAVAGILSDLAPTVLETMGLEKGKEMTGKSLFRLLKA